MANGRGARTAKRAARPEKYATSAAFVSAADARANLSTVVNRVKFGHERILIGRHNQGQVAVISVEDLRLLEQLEDHLDLAAARRALGETGSVSWEVLKAELGL